MDFGRIHQTLRVTPAMQAGFASRIWEIEDLAALVEAKELEAIDAGAINRVLGYENAYHGDFTFIRVRDKNTDHTLVGPRDYYGVNIEMNPK